MWCRVHPGVCFFFFFCSKWSILSLLCNHIAKEWFTRPISSLHVNINVVQYRGKKKIYINVVLFGFSIFWKTAMMFMWCIVFQLVAIIKKNRVAEDLFPLDNLRPQPKQQSSISSLSKLKVKYSKAFQESNITLSSSSMQPPVVSRVLALWDWRLFNLLSRLTPIINLTYSHQHGSYHNHASSAS